MKEITEDYCDFETAKLLKEKGFDEKCFQYWHEKDNELVHSQSTHPIRNVTNPCFFGPAAPTLQMAMKWLRVTYGYYIWVDYSRFDFDKNLPFLWNVVKTEIDGDYYGGTYHKTYEEACEAAIKYCLENLMNK